MSGMKAKRLLAGAVLVLLAACGRSASHMTTATTQGTATTTTAVTAPADVSADIGAAESDMTGVDGDLGAADQDLSTDEPDPTR